MFYRLLIIFVFVFCLACTAHAISGDLNSDNRIDTGDFLIFADNWLVSSPNINPPACDFNADGVVNLSDFAIFAGYWFECNGEIPPVAQSVSVDCGVNDNVIITFVATDDDPLTYRVVSLPIYGTLYDGDTAISSTPYILSGPQVNYHSDSTHLGVISFTWSADDNEWPPCGGATEATAAIHISCDGSAAPVAQSASVDCGVNDSVIITFVATDDDPLTYRVVSLPIYGTLYDGDTAISSAPYALSGSQVNYHSDSTHLGVISFTWSADDNEGPPCGGATEATAEIHIYGVPNATAQSVNTVAYIWQTITLAATDDGYPNPPARLRYIISSLPANGLLYDPMSGAGKIEKVPYTLSSWGDNVWHITDATGGSSFQFKATDCGISPTGGESAAATVSITTAANPHDCLSFDGRGTVSIPDGAYLDVVSGWAIDFWLKTRQSFSTVLKKRGSGAGYEIKMVSGRPKIELYNSDGQNIAAIQYPFRIDDDAWHEIEFTASTITGGWQLLVFVDDSFIKLEYTGNFPAFDNSEPVVGGGQYKGQFDKLRFFTGITIPEGITGIIQGFSGRTQSAGEQIFGFGAASVVLFMCDEGTGATITDSKTGKVGTFSGSSHVQWQPWIVPFTDVSVQQHYYYGGRQ